MTQPRLTFSSEELAVLIRLVSSLNPANYKYPEARSAIEKCKAAVDIDPPVSIRVVP